MCDAVDSCVAGIRDISYYQNVEVDCDRKSHKFVERAFKLCGLPPMCANAEVAAADMCDSTKGLDGLDIWLLNIFFIIWLCILMWHEHRLTHVRRMTAKNAST